MLGPKALAAGYRLQRRDSVVSTMEEARRAAAEGDSGRLWCVAREQTGGRGRHGRVWASPPGNLYTGLLLVAPCEPALAAQLGFVAGLALHDAVAAASGLSRDLALKWPNDLLLGEAKLAGLLLEGETRGSRFDLVIGIGINVASHPIDTPYPAAALRPVAPHVTPDALLTALAESWAERFAQWQRPGGFGPIREAWLERAAFRGEPITIRQGERTLSGRFEGIDPQGRLQLAGDQGLTLVDAGDLYFRS